MGQGQVSKTQNLRLPLRFFVQFPATTDLKNNFQPLIIRDCSVYDSTCLLKLGVSGKKNAEINRLPQSMIQCIVLMTTLYLNGGSRE